MLFAKTGIPEILRTGVQKAQVVGKERLQDRDTLHLKGEVQRREAECRLMGSSSSRTRRIQSISGWTNKSANPAQIHVTEPEGNGWLIELFGINDPVDIPTPQLLRPAKPQA